MDEQTRLENKRRELLAAYRLVSDDLARLLRMREANRAGYDASLAAADCVIRGKIEQLEYAE